MKSERLARIIAAADFKRASSAGSYHHFQTASRMRTVTNRYNFDLYRFCKTAYS